ncbi:MAG: 3'-5' exonuclease [Ktedonobacteraceae bacterium]
MREEHEAPPPEQRRIEETPFIVLDFETVTPKGHSPEPIELGIMRLARGLHLDAICTRNWLITPPDDAPLTEFDTRQTGIHWHDLQGMPVARTVLAEFEALVQGDEYVLVAHSASYEAAILQRFSDVCPRAAAMPCIDTAALGRRLVPHLPNYRLDTLAAHFSLPLPVQRHRALPDVALTVGVFLGLLETRTRTVLPIITIADLTRIAGLRRGAQPQKRPVQMGLFHEERSQ